MGHSFLAYDDQQYVTENAQVLSGLTGHGFVWAFGKHAGNWHPLTWLSHMLDCQVYGLRSWGHHLTNILLHVINTLLLFFFWNRLTGAFWRSALVAALFALHPLHVESVAWVAERKDVLSTLFFMLTLLAYCQYVRRVECRVSSVERPTPRLGGSAAWYILSLLLFALGLMSKPMVVTLPFVLLLLDYWPLHRFALPTLSACAKLVVPLSRALFLRVLLEKGPFLLLTVIGCFLTVSAQQPAMVSTAGLRISQRVEHALVAYVHYLGEIFVPRRLAVYYPYQKGVPVAELALVCCVLAALTVLAVRSAARRPYLVVGWLWFLGTLVPVIGLVQVGDQAWADRYTYLPSIGVFVAVVWGLSEIAERQETGRRILGWLAASAVLALMVGTSVQLSYWKDTRTLFEHTARVTRNNPLAVTLLGSLLEKEGKLDQAIEHYRRALGYSPGFPEAHFFLGHAFDQQGQLDQAIAEYQEALWFKPTQEQTHIFLGAALAKQSQPEQAMAHYRAALRINPESAVAHNNLAKLLHARGQFDEAIVHYSASIKADPNLAQAHNNLGILLLQKGQLVEAIAQLREALRLKPADAESQLNLAQALVQQGQWAEAVSLFNKAVTAATSDPNIHLQFAVALGHLQRTREAMSQYASALLLKEDLPAALDGLAWILATAAQPEFRNGPEAYAMAGRACELTGRNDPEKLKTLAAACAETGRYSEAVFAAQTAHDLAKQGARAELADECYRMIARFKTSQPWRVKN